MLVYDPDNYSPAMLHPQDIRIWQIGAYFGHAVVGADLNNDGFDELIVSAPLYTSRISSYDQGRVFVFWNNPNNSGLNEWVSFKLH